MSKQSDAKERQMYTPKFVPMTCSNCAHVVPVMGQRLVYVNPYRSIEGTRMADVEVGQRCGLGGFAVKKMGSCNEHTYREEAPK